MKTILKEKDEAKKELMLIEILEHNAGKVEEQIIKAEKDVNLVFKRGWVTFETIVQRDCAYDYLFNTSFDRCLAKICCCCRLCMDDRKKL